ncbi:MAG: PIG-L family deacetylase [Desulfamplus sp.]|nr:PIG-L family deacetylase [Desulfamplus sp.]
MTHIKKNQITKYRRILFRISFSIIFFSAFGTLIYVMNARMSAYPYNTSLDYNYDFRGTDSKIINLNLKNGKFTLPPIDDLYSAFIKIEINTTFMGRFFQPEANLTTFLRLKPESASGKANAPDKITISEYFENGAKGVRYINISRFIALSQSKLGSTFDIEIKGKYVLFKDQPLELILFKNQNISHSKILIIAPHPDDAEIAAFGLYSTLSLSNKENRSGNSKNIYVITVTAGDAGTYQYDEIYSNRKNHFLKKGKIRTWNSITVPLLAGIPPDNVLNLGFFDGTLETMFNINPGSVKAPYTGISDINLFRKQNISHLVNILEGEANWNSLVKNIENLLIEIEPDIIVAPYPAIDSHPDHKFSSIALFEAIKRVDISIRQEQIGNSQNKEDGINTPHLNYDNKNRSSYDIKSRYLYLYTNHFVLNEYYPYGKSGGVISLPPAFKESIYFKSIYSHLLSPDREREKILSLEAMNDLRPDTSWRFSDDALKMAVMSIKRNVLGKDVSYYRRSVRNNELFFVIPISDIYNKFILNRIIGGSEQKAAIKY